jgi:hypothetical protein
VRRLTVATRGGDLLEQKLRITMAGQDFSLLVEHLQVAWTDAARALDGLLRSALLSGERSCAWRVTAGAASTSVAADVGARYPAAADCVPDRPATAFTPTTPRSSTRSRRRRRCAGVDHAVATAASPPCSRDLATRPVTRVTSLDPRLESAHDK